MNLMNKLMGEFVDIIEWTDDSMDTIVWRFPRYHDQIKYGAQLTVRETQNAVFVNEGQIADVFKPGMYTLETRNMPVLSTIRGWKHGFDSPFRAEVYFVNTRNFTDLKWGTRNPIIVRDPEFGPVRLRAFGSYVIRVQDAGEFVKEIAGTNQLFTLEGITEQLRNLIVTRFSDYIAEAKIPVLDLASNYDELSSYLTEKITPEFQEYGLDVTKLLVENISLPEEVEQALDKRSSMGIVGNLDKFLKYQAGTAMEAAAANPGGDASAGVGMGMGFAMANQMGQSLMGQQQAGGGAPPPLPGQEAVQYFVGQDGQRTGPFDTDAIGGMIRAGTIRPETLVWAKGMPAWQAAGRVAALASHFGAVPPPLPPS
jgi:membrane protease subunit (stomatin/prohibitin family)